MLTLALLLAWCTPRSSGYTPFEILYGRTSPVIGRLKGNPQPIADREMSQHLQALGKVFYHIAQETLERTPITLGNWVHPYQPGDELQASSLGSTTLESRRQLLHVMRTYGKPQKSPQGLVPKTTALIHQRRCACSSCSRS